MKNISSVIYNGKDLDVVKLQEQLKGLPVKDSNGNKIGKIISSYVEDDKIIAIMKVKDSFSI